MSAPAAPQGAEPGRPAAPWPTDADALDVEQRRLAALRPAPWTPPEGRLRVAGTFIAYAHGEQGPGRAGDRLWAAAAVVEVPGQDEPIPGREGAGHRLLSRVVVAATAGAPYDPGRLALREGPALAAAVAGLAVVPDVVMVDATGRDHPRRAGLALHLGAVVGLPSVGVTHRPLLGTGEWPPAEEGAAAPLRLEAAPVGAWLRTRATARPLAVHAGWRTDPDTAVAVVARAVACARTPEPLRLARVAARTARSVAEGRAR